MVHRINGKFGSKFVFNSFCKTSFHSFGMLFLSTNNGIPVNCLKYLNSFCCIFVCVNEYFFCNIDNDFINFVSDIFSFI